MHLFKICKNKFAITEKQKRLKIIAQNDDYFKKKLKIKQY